MGLGEFLTLVLLIMKVFGNVDFTWLQVFLPMIIIYGLILVILIMWSIVAIFSALICR